MFTDKAPWIMRLLMEDFALSRVEAAAILGNLGHETGGFRLMQERNPVVAGSRGGYGWAQWTGSRRRSFEAYCRRNSLDPASDQANYGFLFVELSGSERRAITVLKQGAVSLSDAVRVFEKAFERAGVKHYASRVRWAERALAAFNADPTPRMPAWARPGPPDVDSPDSEPAAPPPAGPGGLAAVLTALLRALARLLQRKD